MNRVSQEEERREFVIIDHRRRARRSLRPQGQRTALRDFLRARSEGLRQTPLRLLPQAVFYRQRFPQKSGRQG
jgi:hypothetical protein